MAPLLCGGLEAAGEGSVFVCLAGTVLPSLWLGLGALSPECLWRLQARYLGQSEDVGCHRYMALPAGEAALSKCAGTSVMAMASLAPSPYVLRRKEGFCLAWAVLIPSESPVGRVGVRTPGTDSTVRLQPALLGTVWRWAGHGAACSPRPARQAAGAHLGSGAASVRPGPTE